MEGIKESENGVAEDGIMKNGILENGVVETAFAEKGPRENGVEDITQQSPSMNTDFPSMPPRKRPTPPARDQPASKKVKPKSTKTRTSKDDIFDDVNSILGPEGSPLYGDNIDLMAILKHPLAIETLRREKGEEFVNELLETLTADQKSVALSKFKDDGRLGRHDPDWISEAIDATRRRNIGDFDEFLDYKFKEDWDPDSNEKVQENSQDKNEDSQDPGGDDGDYPDKNDPGFSDNNALPDAHQQDFSDLNPRPNHQQKQQGSDNGNGKYDDAEESPEPVQDSPPPMYETTSSILPPPLAHLPTQSSKQKLTTFHYDGQKIKAFKTGEEFEAQGKHVRLVACNQHKFLSIAIPCGKPLVSRLESDVIYPHINDPARLLEAMQDEDPHIQTKSRGWKLFDVYCGETLLGKLWDIRQACEWSRAELGFQNRIRFLPGRSRRLVKEESFAGYQFINFSTLYKKIPSYHPDHGQLSKEPVVDLGPRLKFFLLQLSIPEYELVMYDVRVLVDSGVVAPIGLSAAEALNLGPQVFPTSHCRLLAGQHGWSNGHAFVVQQTFVTSTGGAAWTSAEIDQVQHFHKEHITNKILHLPVPVTLDRHNTHLHPAQLSLVGGIWVPDSHIHGGQESNRGTSRHYSSDHLALLIREQQLVYGPQATNVSIPMSTQIENRRSGRFNGGSSSDNNPMPSDTPSDNLQIVCEHSSSIARLLLVPEHQDFCNNDFLQRDTLDYDDGPDTGNYQLSSTYQNSGDNSSGTQWDSRYDNSTVSSVSHGLSQNSYDQETTKSRLGESYVGFDISMVDPTLSQPPCFAENLLHDSQSSIRQFISDALTPFVDRAQFSSGARSNANVHHSMLDHPLDMSNTQDRANGATATKATRPRHSPTHKAVWFDGADERDDRGKEHPTSTFPGEGANRFFSARAFPSLEDACQQFLGREQTGKYSSLSFLTDPAICVSSAASTPPVYSHPGFQPVSSIASPSERRSSVTSPSPFPRLQSPVDTANLEQSVDPSGLHVGSLMPRPAENRSPYRSPYRSSYSSQPSTPQLSTAMMLRLLLCRSTARKDTSAQVSKPTSAQYAVIYRDIIYGPPLSRTDPANGRIIATWCAPHGYPQPPRDNWEEFMDHHTDLGFDATDRPANYIALYDAHYDEHFEQYDDQGNWREGYPRECHPIDCCGCQAYKCRQGMKDVFRKWDWDRTKKEQAERAMLAAQEQAKRNELAAREQAKREALAVQKRLQREIAVLEQADQEEFAVKRQRESDAIAAREQAENNALAAQKKTERDIADREQIERDAVESRQRAEWIALVARI